MEIGGREMDFNQVADKPRAVCIPFPAQGHIAPLLKLAKLLHFNGFHITFVSTEYNHTRLLKSRGSNSLDGSPDFRFEAIPDGLPQTDDSDATQGIPSICESAAKNCSVPFRNILHRLDDSTSSPTSSRWPVMVLMVLCPWHMMLPRNLGSLTYCCIHSACGLLGYTQFRVLVERGLTPLKGIKVVSCSKFKIHVNFGSITVLTPQEMRRVRLTAKKLFL
jgi:hypothetical protein